MDLSKIPTGANPPEDCNVLIECPLGGEPHGWSVWASNDGINYTQIVDTATWQSTFDGFNYYPVIPTAWKSARYFRLRLDDYWQAPCYGGFYAGTTVYLVWLYECVP